MFKVSYNKLPCKPANPNLFSFFLSLMASSFFCFFSFSRLEHKQNIISFIQYIINDSTVLCPLRIFCLFFSHFFNNFSVLSQCKSYFLFLNILNIKIPLRDNRFSLRYVLYKKIPSFHNIQLPKVTQASHQKQCFFVLSNC